MYFQKVTCHVDFVTPVNIETEALQRMVPKDDGGQKQKLETATESDSDDSMISLNAESQSKDELVSLMFNSIVRILSSSLFQG